MHLIARVLDNMALDIAAQTPSGELVVIRCVETISIKDVQAVRAMLAEGPFVRALMVSRRAPAAHDDIPYCQVNDIDAALHRLVSGSS